MRYEQIVLVSSNDRDSTNYPSTSRFQVAIPTVKNVKAVEFIGGVVPDKNSVTSEPYLILTIEELMHERLIATNRFLEKSFAVLMLSPPNTPGTFASIDTSLSEKMVYSTTSGNINLNKLTINILKSTGELFDFGGNYQTMFMIKFICED